MSNGEDSIGDQDPDAADALQIVDKMQKNLQKLKESLTDPDQIKAVDELLGDNRNLLFAIFNLGSSVRNSGITVNMLTGIMNQGLGRRY